ncbi:MAG TPA: Hsp20/alpha crystallin family protein [Gammaproteobacteria bacterium]
MSLMRYEPMSMLDQLRREMERMYGDRGSADEAHIATASDWVPAVDIKEEQECFVIKADLPGVDPKNIEVHAEGGMLTIRGERDTEKKEERSGYKRIERSYGSFFRRFTLPDTADTDKITAKGTNGVLEIRIPKHEKLQPRKISVEG